MSAEAIEAAEAALAEAKNEVTELSAQEAALSEAIEKAKANHAPEEKIALAETLEAKYNRALATFNDFPAKANHAGAETNHSVAKTNYIVALNNYVVAGGREIPIDEDLVADK